MQKKNKHLLLFSFVFAFLSASAQKQKPLNLPSYDHDKLHFGFALGINKANFLILPAVNSSKPDSVLSLNDLPDWGFSLGIISDLRIHDYATLRFLPTLTFQSRAIEYQIHPSNSTNLDTFYTTNKKIESTLLDFPVNLKIRSERLNNMSAYLLAGGKFCIDLASQEKTVNPDILKLNSKDFALEAGFGLDFYLQYFKLSTEIKFAAGIKNRLFPENTTWAAPINMLKTKTWVFSLNFEG